MAMQILAWIFAALTLSLAVLSIYTWNRRRSRENRRCVQLPFVLAFVGMLCGGFFSVMLIFAAREGWGLFLCALAFTLLGDYMMSHYVNGVVLYDNDGFTTRNVWGKQFSCRYADVKGIRIGKDHWIYYGKRKLLVDAISKGGPEFLLTLERSYKKQTGKDLPMDYSYGRRRDPMNGHIEYPWLYFTIWIFLIVGSIAIPALCMYSMTVETDLADLTVQTVEFSRYDTYEGTLRLYTAEEEQYRISFYQDYGSVLPAPEQLCNGQPYQVYTEEDSRYIKGLRDDRGKDLITPQLERQVYRDSQRGAVILILVLSPLGIVYGILGILIARNPDKYPYWLQRLFYKKNVLY